ncbi:lytic polysaccharide monooxygenase [Sphaerimonospora thailandensis]|uniref:Cellulose-binding protein n=1 Tax=Sphaerimonospora thailandensis TaxID=795644 RepID=A0A8J3W0P6_9ACTN|nr:lytic polysaccharide monooxygenase [Sphaerimonospora thailandensis]GIH71328.1 cellulose-binding protein [Sphaerimonospora thailandensis]
MRKTLTFVSTASLAIGAGVFFASPASAHGYVSSPMSRQAQCAQGVVSGCGNIQYEPQSVEGPKGQLNCTAGDSRWAPLGDDSKGWRATSVGSSASFTWTFTARHATSTWDYYIAGRKIASFSGGGKQPGATVTHNVNLSGYSGRQKVIAVWNVADTPNAFYSCVDVQIGGGGGTPPTQPPTEPSTPPTQPSQPPTQPSQPPSQPGGTWKAGTSYKAGDQVTYGGATYRCVQAHTALTGWEPSNVPALWQRV